MTQTPDVQQENAAASEVLVDVPVWSIRTVNRLFVPKIHLSPVPPRAAVRPGRCRFWRMEFRRPSTVQSYCPIQDPAVMAESIIVP